MDLESLNNWLEETDHHGPYWANVREVATQLGSDGCTGVVDIFLDACLEHDIHFRTHKFLCGCDIEFKEANYVFRRRMQQRSPIGRYSVVSWVRWWAVSHFGRKAWDHK